MSMFQGNVVFTNKRSDKSLKKALKPESNTEKTNNGISVYFQWDKASFQWDNRIIILLYTEKITEKVFSALLSSFSDIFSDLFSYHRHIKESLTCIVVINQNGT